MSSLSVIPVTTVVRTAEYRGMAIFLFTELILSYRFEKEVSFSVFCLVGCTYNTMCLFTGKGVQGKRHVSGVGLYLFFFVVFPRVLFCFQRFFKVNRKVFHIPLANVFEIRRTCDGVGCVYLPPRDVLRSPLSVLAIFSGV